MDKVKRSYHNFGKHANNWEKLSYSSIKLMRLPEVETAICMRQVEEYYQLF
jgi:hypothetical protein